MWDNVFEMVEDMQRAVTSGEIVQSSDDPMRRVIGFVGNLNCWEISLVAVIETGIHRCKNSKQRAVRQLIKTIAGRAKLCEPDTIRQLRELETTR